MKKALSIQLYKKRYAHRKKNHKIEDKRIAFILNEHGGNVAAAAQFVGVHYITFWNWANKGQLPRDSRRLDLAYRSAKRKK